jgi:hypothetical protein
MRFTIALIIVIIATTTGCPSSSLTEEYCNRADSCNILKNSVEECIQDSDAALDKLPKNQRDEVEYEVKQCLDHPSCASFAACVESLSSGSGSGVQ